MRNIFNNYEKFGSLIEKKIHMKNLNILFENFEIFVENVSNE